MGIGFFFFSRNLVDLKCSVVLAKVISPVLLSLYLFVRTKLVPDFTNADANGAEQTDNIERMNITPFERLPECR